MSRIGKGTAALELWAKNATDGYRGVSIKNMTKSWRNGLAFCALIHRFHPELIDFDSLDESDIIGNCSLAFEVAESKLGIPALLDPEDMLANEVPDRLSILTYVAQYYNTLKNSSKKSNVSPSGAAVDENLPNGNVSNRVGSKRIMDSDDIIESTRDRTPKRPVLLSSSTVCSVCHNPVYILERVLFTKKLYHRSCFRCSNCDSVLNPQTADISPDGRLFCLENDCHRKLQLLSRRVSTSTPTNIKTVEKQSDVKANPTLVTQSQLGDKPSDILHTISVVPDSVDSEKPTHKHEKVKPSDSNSNTLYTNSKYQSIIEFFSQSADSEKFPEKVGILQKQPEPQPDPIPMQEDPSDILHTDTTAQSKTIKTAELRKENEAQNVVAVDLDSGGISQKMEESEIQDNSNPFMEPESNLEGAVQSSVSGENDTFSTQILIEKTEKDEAADFKSKINTAIISEGIIEADDELPNDRLNVEVVENPTDTDKARTVSFSAIVEVSQIETDPSSEVVVAKTKGKIEPLNIPAEPLSDSFVEVIESPKTKPKNAFEFIKDNVETLSGTKEKETTPTEVDIVTTPTEVDIVTSVLPDEMLRIQSKDKDSEENQHELASHNESGVGDSLQSDVKSETDSVNLSIGDSKDKFSSSGSASGQEDKCDDHDDVNQIMNEMAEISSTSLVLPGGEGESSENQTPRRLPRLPRSTSPSLDRSPAPTPTPRKRISGREHHEEKKEEQANELWKTKDYYPSELNPFESEDTFTLQPSDILVVKKGSSRERLAPSNPFEDDEGEEEQIVPIVPVNSPQVLPTPPPKSPAHSINSSRSVESINGSVRGRSRKSRHAPLPPTMMTPKKVISPHKGPAPPPPSQTHSQPLTNNNNNGTPEKKIIPASPDLLKGLKNQANKAAAQHYKKKRRAPPPKRFVTPLPEATIKTELADLNIKEKELERQGISLEATIRRMMAQEEDSNEEQIDEMVIQLWSIVNEKNDILRRQTELDYLRRGHRLEELQAEVEFQLRVLMETPSDQRQPGHEEAEQQLLEELLKIVDERNEVVDWLDFHRQIDREEDLHVSQSLSSFATLSRSSTPTPTHVVLPIKSETVTEESKNATLKGKNKEKDKGKEDGKSNKKFKIGFFSKKKKASKSKKQDEDKDNDESLKVA